MKYYNIYDSQQILCRCNCLTIVWMLRVYHFVAAKPVKTEL